jgi:hypothetical protein
MLLNLSNHPSPTWPPEQRQAAEQHFGPGITDLPFPQITPEADEQAIEDLADGYHRRIMAMNPKPAAVHLMGEMTFTFALVKRLQASGLRCVASTTARDVVEEGGVKVSKFRFVRFRAYVV